MNGRSASTPPPTPGPFCAVYSPLLPLLGARALTPEEEASLREHLVDCAWCRNQLAAYATVEDALRQRYASAPSAQSLTLEDIMRASRSESQPSETSRQASRQPLRTTDLPDRTGSSRSAMRDREPRRPKPWATLGALAAVALLVVLAAALFANLRPRTPGGAPATSVPAASCATALQGATPATAIPGFTNVTFPAGAVMTTVKSSLGGPSQFTVLETDVCYSGAADDLTGPVSDHHSVIANLLGAGWGVLAVLPLPGRAAPVLPQPVLSDGEHALSRAGADHGSWRQRLHVSPAARRAATDADLQRKFHQFAHPGRPDLGGGGAAAANHLRCPRQRGGPARLRSVQLGQRRLNHRIPHQRAACHRLDEGRTDARCFYADQCWITSSAAISWHVNDPTNWTIAYHPATS